METQQTPAFKDWFNALRDVKSQSKSRAALLARTGLMGTEPEKM
jgi:putative component of toxin-antitoxin plasmid stabilization module